MKSVHTKKEVMKYLTEWKRDNFGNEHYDQVTKYYCQSYKYLPNQFRKGEKILDEYTGLHNYPSIFI